MPDPDAPSPGEARRGRAAIVAAGVLWSTGGLFIKSLTAGGDAGLSAVGITCYRSLFAALCLLPLIRGRRIPKARVWLPAVGLYVTLLITYVASTQGTTAANAILLQYTAPFWAALLAGPLLGEPVGRSEVGPLAVAGAGIAVLFVGSYRGAEQAPLLLGALSGLSFGLFLLYLRKHRSADPVALTAINNLGVAAVAGVWMLLTAPDDAALVAQAWAHPASQGRILAVTAAMGVLQIAAPYVLFSFGLRWVSAVEAGLFALLEPVLNPVWVALFFGELPTPATVVGGACLLGALAYRSRLRASVSND